MIDKFRSGLAWILFFMGDMVSKPMERFDLWYLYPLYNWLMLTSLDVQGKENNNGPWKDAL